MSRSESAFETHVTRQRRARSMERKKRKSSPSRTSQPSPSRTSQPSPSRTSQPSPSPSPSPCARGKVRNPASGRCVKHDSRALLFSGYYNGGVPLDFLDCPAGKVYSALSARCVSAKRASKSRAPAAPARNIPLTNKDWAMARVAKLLESRDVLSPDNVAFIEGTLRRQR